MNSETAIKVSGLTKCYEIGKQKDESLRSFIGSLLFIKRYKKESFQALNNLNFEIKKGEVVGIIGKNGAGKSTLLKILSQITQPTKGRIEINGRIASLLEVGTGFHPELTGRENIYLNGTILGMTRSEVKSKFDEIVEFSGVEKFIDTPVKHYSSGMYVRLAFAVAAHLEPEILIIDEVLAVGDAEFQKKCLGKMDEVAKTGRTVLFVSHNMAAVKSLCSSGILIEKGELGFAGNIKDTIALYNADKPESSFYDTTILNDRHRGIKQIIIKTITLSSSRISSNQILSISIKILKKDPEFYGHINLALFFFDGLKNTVYHISTEFLNQKINLDENSTYDFAIEPIGLNEGTYSIGVWLQGNGVEQDYVDDQIFFNVSFESNQPNRTAKMVGIVEKDFKFRIQNS